MREYDRRSVAEANEAQAVAPGAATGDAAAIHSQIANGRADPADIARFLRARPAAVHEVMVLLHRTLGNGFVQQVSRAMQGPGASMETAERPAQAPAAGGSNTHAALRDAEASFGADFSDVEVRRDGRADALGAQAFAQGNEISLAGDGGGVSTPEGRALLGHELAHVVQQREGRVTGAQAKGGAVHRDEALEAEADQAGAAFARGEPVPAAARSSGGQGRGQAVQAKPEDAPIQLFDAVKEHKAAGDEGSGGLEYLWNGAKVTEAPDRLPTSRKHPQDCELRLDARGQVVTHFEFRLTHGDIVMLSGDLFDPRDVDEHGAPIPDSLFKLAAKPSTDPGQKCGTQDEIIYAIYDKNPNDIRFSNQCTKQQPNGGPWALYPHRYQFSRTVIDSVESRYLRLAAKNRDHFVRPDEKQKGIGGPRDSGGGAYRSLHEDALWLAYQAGRAKADGGEALAREAAAEHFLTDAFSAGHVRTPRASIQNFWDARYPRFNQGFQDVLEEGITTALSSQTVGGFIPDAIIGHVVHLQVQAMLAGAPPLSFGDLMGRLAHDEDNAHGLWVVNDLNQKWKAYGDGHMYEADPDNRTPEMTRLAVTLGVDDIRTAQVLGTLDAGDAARKPAELHAEVRARASAPAVPGAKYAAEQVIPRPDPDRAAGNGVQNWTSSSFDDLWKLKVRTDRPETYGQIFTAALRPGGLFYDKLAGKAPGIAESNHGLHPRAAYLEFLGRLQRDPEFWIYYISRKAS